MRNLHTTPQVLKLKHALERVGISAEEECADGHKHVDLCIHEAKLYIEVEGPPHFLNARQIEADFLRDDYSAVGGFETFRIPNEYIDTHCYKLVAAIKKVADHRIKLSKGV